MQLNRGKNPKTFVCHGNSADVIPSMTKNTA